mgnify:FL=1
MGSVYDRTEKEYYHNKRHCCTCRDTGILLPNVGRGSFYPMLFSYLRSFIYFGLFAAWGRASKEIGNEFGVSANLVCAWVSKARKYLKSRPEILALAEI